MALIGFDKTTELFTTGDVVAYESFGKTYALKLLKEVYIEEVGEYRYVGQLGTVEKEKFVATPSADLALYSVKELRYDYSSKWKPGVVFQVGDLLKDTKTGELFMVQSETAIWNLSSGTVASRGYWEGDTSVNAKRKFQVQETRGGSKFSQHFTAK